VLFLRDKHGGMQRYTTAADYQWDSFDITGTSDKIFAAS